MLFYLTETPPWSSRNSYEETSVAKPQSLRITLDAATFDELCVLAREELRRPADQVAWLVQQAVKTRLAHAAAMRHLEGVGPAPLTPPGDASW
jgi:hypothetical protein